MSETASHNGGQKPPTDPPTKAGDPPPLFPAKRRGFKITTGNDNWAGQKLANDDHFSNFTGLAGQTNSFDALGAKLYATAETSLSMYNDEFGGRGRKGEDVYLRFKRPNVSLLNMTASLNRLTYDQKGKWDIQHRSEARAEFNHYGGAGSLGDKVQNDIWHEQVVGIYTIPYEDYNLGNFKGANVSLGHSVTASTPLNDKISLSLNSNAGATFGDFKGAGIGVGAGIGNISYNDRINYKTESINQNFFPQPIHNNAKVNWSVAASGGLNYLNKSPLYGTVVRDIYRHNVYAKDLIPENSIEERSTKLGSGIQTRTLHNKINRLVPHGKLEVAVDILKKAVITAGISVEGNSLKHTKQHTNFEFDAIDEQVIDQLRREGFSVTDKYIAEIEANESYTNPVKIPAKPHIYGEISVTVPLSGKGRQ